MLRKRTRSVEKEQNKGASDSVSNSESVAQRHRMIPFLNAPSQFRWQAPPPVLLDSGSNSSPPSPLDFGVLSNPANPFRNLPSSDCEKVGLGIVDSIAGIAIGKDNGNGKASGEVKQPSDARKVVFAPQMKIRGPNYGAPVDIFEGAKSLPEAGHRAGFPPVQPNVPTDNRPLFEIGAPCSEPDPISSFVPSSLDSGRAFIPLTKTQMLNLCPNLCYVDSATETGFVIASPGLQSAVLLPLSASEIERSEDYTRVVTHGPNPKTTHIYGDCILGCHPRDLSKFFERMEKEFVPANMEGCYMIPARFPSRFFLSFCYLCNRKLAGRDIYMYRGEIPFCSEACREWKMFAAGHLVYSPGKSPGPSAS